MTKKKNEDVGRRMAILLGLLFVFVMFFAFLQPFGYTVSGNWIRVSVEDSQGNPIEDVRCRLQEPEEYEQVLLSDSLGTVTFKGDIGDTLSFPSGSDYYGYCNCDDTIKEFSGFTFAGSQIALRTVVCYSGETYCTPNEKVVLDSYCNGDYAVSVEKQCYVDGDGWSNTYSRSVLCDYGCVGGVCRSTPTTTKMVTTSQYPTTTNGWPTTSLAQSCEAFDYESQSVGPDCIQKYVPGLGKYCWDCDGLGEDAGDELPAWFVGVIVGGILVAIVYIAKKK